MKLTILGSGTYQPELERHSSSYLIETDNGNKICFDFGRGAIEQLLKLGIAITEIDVIFLSHWHGDHVGDLISLMQYTIAPLPDEVSLLRPARKKSLKIYGPLGTNDNLEFISKAIRYGKSNLRNIEVHEMSNDKVEIGDLIVESFLTDHEPNAICFRAKSNGKTFAYSGDSIETDGLSSAIKNADLAIIEAGWPEKVNPKTHMTGQRAGKIAQENGVKKLVITHMSPLYLKDFDPKKDAQRFFKGEVILAKDLMQIKL